MLYQSQTSVVFQFATATTEDGDEDASVFGGGGATRSATCMWKTDTIPKPLPTP